MNLVCQRLPLGHVTTTPLPSVPIPSLGSATVWKICLWTAALPGAGLGLPPGGADGLQTATPFLRPPRHPTLFSQPPCTLYRPAVHAHGAHLRRPCPGSPRPQRPTSLCSSWPHTCSARLPPPACWISPQRGGRALPATSPRTTSEQTFAVRLCRRWRSDTSVSRRLRNTHSPESCVCGRRKRSRGSCGEASGRCEGDGHRDVSGRPRFPITDMTNTRCVCAPECVTHTRPPGAQVGLCRRRC